jgi:hypothetical protein
MEAAKKRILRSGREYDHLFPKAEVGTQTILRVADVNDTCSFIPKVVTRRLTRPKLLLKS